MVPPLCRSCGSAMTNVHAGCAWLKKESPRQTMRAFQRVRTRRLVAGLIFRPVHLRKHKLTAIVVSAASLLLSVTDLSAEEGFACA